MMVSRGVMDVLKDEAIRVYPGMITVYPQFAQEEALNLTEMGPKFNGQFSVNNSTVAFVYEDELYVTPCTGRVMGFLESAGFTKACFFVPFSNWDYPKAEQSKWNKLLENARAARVDEFRCECRKYCKEHKIRAIREKSLSRCFEMPESGVKVLIHRYEDCYYPVINTTVMDQTVINSLGHYCTNNGRVVFTHVDGRTYVTKGYGIVKELMSSGYTEAGMFVPFSNGEVLLDPIQKFTWESIAKK